MDLGTKIFLTGLTFFIASLVCRGISKENFREEPAIWVLLVITAFLGGLLMMFLGPLVGIWSAA